MDFYAEYDLIVADWLAIIDECKHENRCFAIQYKGQEHRFCGDCSIIADPIETTMSAARKSARKREMAAQPRCSIDGCKRRGTGWTFGALLCGAHFKVAKREHNRSLSSGIGLFISPTYTSDDIRHMAEGRAV